MKTYKLLICNDHAVVRAGLRMILEKEKDFQVVGEAENAGQVIELAAHYQPDLILMNLSISAAKGYQAISGLRETARHTKVVVISVHGDEHHFFQALQAGAAGYVLEGASVGELLAALRLVIQGGMPIPRALASQLLNDYLKLAIPQAVPSFRPLSTREHEILQLIRKGRTNKQIAEELYLSVRTVERYRGSIMHKAGLRNRVELVTYAVRQSLFNDTEMR